MSFSILPFEIKIKIFNMLSIGSRYNASQVWEEMAEETYKSIPTDGDGLIRRLTNKEGTDTYYQTKKIPKIHIAKVDDLELSGVLALTGHLELVEDLTFSNFDFSSSPSNIVNGLTKIVTGTLAFTNYVTGLCSSMMENINCKGLYIYKMTVPAQIPSDIRVSKSVTLDKVFGNVFGLLEAITCSGEENAEDLERNALNISIENMPIMEELPHKIRVSGEVKLFDLRSGLSGLLDIITCESLSLCCSIWNNLDTDAKKSLIHMFSSRVRNFTWYVSVDELADIDFLTNYDGQGHCEIMNFIHLAHYLNDDEIENEDLINKNKEKLRPWIESIGWTITVNENNIEIKRTKDN